MMTSTASLRPTRVPTLTLAELLAGYEVEYHGEAAALTSVRGVSVDSLDIEAGEAFIALAGANVHAAKFALDAQSRGAVAVITDSEGAQILREIGSQLPVAVIAEPRQQAGPIAIRAYGAPAEKMLTLAVTGTNGKTTTAIASWYALEAAGLPTLIMSTAEIRFQQVQIAPKRTTLEGPALARVMAWALEQGARAAVIETSSHALSLWRVEGISFDAACFTNLQHDHLDYYRTMDAYFAAKASLFEPGRTRFAAVAIDDRWGRQLAGSLQVPHALVQTPLADSEGEMQAGWQATQVQPSSGALGQEFTLDGPGGSTRRVKTQLPGLVNVQNLSVAYAALRAGLGLEDEAILAGFAKAQTPGRMQVVAPRSSLYPMVIVDYAHTPEALVQTLADVANCTDREVVLVFGTDGDRDATKRFDLAVVASRGAHRLWVTDENPRFEDAASIRAQLLDAIATERPDFAAVTEIQTCRRDAVREAILAADPRDVVVITGKGSEWYQEIRGVDHVYSDAAVVAEVMRSKFGDRWRDRV